MKYAKNNSLRNISYAMLFSQTGPLPSTIPDLWRLVWQKNVHVISMLTNTVELGQRKCEQYWPESGSQTYGPFEVTLTEEQTFADFTIRSFMLQVHISITMKPTLILHSLYVQRLLQPVHSVWYTYIQYHDSPSSAFEFWSPTGTQFIAGLTCICKH